MNGEDGYVALVGNGFGMAFMKEALEERMLVWYEREEVYSVGGGEGSDGLVYIGLRGDYLVDGVYRKEYLFCGGINVGIIGRVVVVGAHIEYVQCCAEEVDHIPELCERSVNAGVFVGEGKAYFVYAVISGCGRHCKHGIIQLFQRFIECAVGPCILFLCVVVAYNDEEWFIMFLRVFFDHFYCAAIEYLAVDL